MAAVTAWAASSSTMRAVVIRKYGRAAAEIVDLPRPAAADLREGQVLLRIHAVALNAMDYKTRAGTIKAFLHEPKAAKPVVLGYDCSGMVEAVGPGVTEWAVGDAVFGVCITGALASYGVAYANNLARKPLEITHGEAACLVTAGLTALQMLDRAVENAGALRKVLITAGGGGVGHFAVQLAKHVFHAETVVATASTGKVDLVRSLGADVVLDYTTDDFVEILKEKPCDAALDNTGEARRCLQAVRRDVSRNVVSIVAKGGGPRIPTGHMARQVREVFHQPPVNGCLLGLMNCLTDKQVESLIVLPTSSELQRLVLLWGDRKLRVVVDRIFPFERAVHAIDHLEQGHAVGKVIVELVAGGTEGLVEVQRSRSIE